MGMRAMPNTNAFGLECGIDGKKQGLRALRTVHVAKIGYWHGALNARAHRWVTMGAMPWSS